MLLKVTLQQRENPDMHIACCSVEGIIAMDIIMINIDIDIIIFPF